MGNLSLREQLLARCMLMPANGALFGHHGTAPTLELPFDKSKMGKYIVHKEGDKLGCGAFVHDNTGMTYLFGAEQATIVVEELKRCGYVHDKTMTAPNHGDAWFLDAKLVAMYKAACQFEMV